MNQIVTYVAYGVGGIFLLGALWMFMGIFKASPEQAAEKKAAELEKKAAKEAAKAAKKATVFSSASNKKDLFQTSSAGEGGAGLSLSTPAKKGFKQPSFEVVEEETATIIETPKVIEEVVTEAPAAVLPEEDETVTEEAPNLSGSVFGSGSGFKLTEGSDDNAKRFNLPF